MTGPDDPTRKIRASSPSGTLRALGHSPDAVRAALPALGAEVASLCLAHAIDAETAASIAREFAASDAARRIVLDAVLATVNPPQATVPVVDDDGAAGDPKLREAWQEAWSAGRTEPTADAVTAVLWRRYGVLATRAWIATLCAQAGLPLAPVPERTP